LGHTQTSTTQRYAHLEQNPAKQAAEEAAAKLAALTVQSDAPADSQATDEQPPQAEPGRRLTLRELRIREGLSQKDLAELSGVTFQSISTMENGKRRIGKAMAQRLADTLNVDWTELVTAP
jgi:DNA-binding XRE family transcriptional regulator